MAKEIAKHYKNEDKLVMLCNLNGAMFFYVDLYREVCKLRTEFESVEMACVQTSSYNNAKECLGEDRVDIISIYNCLDSELNLLIVDDIMDTGYAMNALIGNIIIDSQERIMPQMPKSIESCVLVNKTERRVGKDTRTNELMKSTFKGFDVPNGYLVGYGMGIGDKYRYLPDIYRHS